MAKDNLFFNNIESELTAIADEAEMYGMEADLVKRIRDVANQAKEAKQDQNDE